MRLVLLTALLLATVPAAAPAMAAKRDNKPVCSCTPVELAQKISAADQIFTARVERIADRSDMAQPGRDDPPVEVHLVVSEVFKGLPDGAKKAVLHTSLTRVTCTGHPFVAGREYLVYGYRRLASSYEDWSLYDFPTGTVGTGGLCGGTAPMGTAQSAAEIAKLQAMKAAGAIPQKPVPELERQIGNSK